MTATTVVVTGGAGFLGSHLVPILARAGRPVRVVDAAPPPSWLPLPGVELVQADLADPQAGADAVAGAEVVVHAAFAPPSVSADRLRQVNTEGTRALCRAAQAAGVKQVIVISSTIVDRDPRRHPVLRASPLDRLDAYRSTRAEAESVALAAAGPRMQVAIARPKTFVGPGRVGGFALVFDLVRRGVAVPILGPGTNRYQLVDVRDLAHGLRLLVELGGDGLYSFGSSSYGTVAEDLGALITAAGTGARLRRLPAGLGRAAVTAVELAGLDPLAEWHHCTAARRDSVVDTDRARRGLGWEPQRSNATSLIDAYRWYDEQVRQTGDATTTQAVPRSHRLLSGLGGGFHRTDRSRRSRAR